MIILRIGLAIGDRVRVRQNTCAFCAGQRAGAVGRSGRVESIHEWQEWQELVSANLVPPDHSVFVLYDQPWSDGLFGAVRGQFFKSDELEHI